MAVSRLLMLTCCVVSLPCLAGNEIALSTSEHDAINDMVKIDGGWYVPFYKENGLASKTWVDHFYIDRYQVTNRQFAAFIRDSPKWQPHNISQLFADNGYLAHLTQSTSETDADKPVVNVSWYASMAYCKALGRTLPSVDQWEYVARANDIAADATDLPAFKQKILQWYAKPATDALPDVHDTPANVWGVHGIHGVVWEQVSDFNTTATTGESRGDSALDKQLFCGSGAARAVDPGDYAAFMRYALRGSYKAQYTLSSLGFRCARNI